MMGCSRDHAAEIDIYNKPYKEKIARITMMKEQGNKAIQEHGKMIKSGQEELKQPVAEEKKDAAPIEET